MHSILRVSTLVLFTVSLLGACAPAAQEREEARVDVTPSGPAAYRPEAPGSQWTYLPDGAGLDEPRVRIEIEGPTVVGGAVLTAWHMEGRGLDVRWYRDHREDGTYLVREERPGTLISFDPPILEWTQEPMYVGMRWSGTTEATIRFPGADTERQPDQLSIEYAVEVVDRRDVRVAAGTFDVFVVNFTTLTRDEAGEVVETLTQETWVAPNLGEVRTENGFFLIGSNLLGASSAP